MPDSPVWEWNMAVENLCIRKLSEARAQAVRARREVANTLATPYKHGHPENMHEVFVKLQDVIEAIDRAIDDEQRIEKDGGRTAG
jgi:hypothetical protein